MRAKTKLDSLTKTNSKKKNSSSSKTFEECGEQFDICDFSLQNVWKNGAMNLKKCSRSVSYLFDRHHSIIAAIDQLQVREYFNYHYYAQRFTANQHTYRFFKYFLTKRRDVDEQIEKWKINKSIDAKIAWINDHLIETAMSEHFCVVCFYFAMQFSNRFLFHVSGQCVCNEIIDEY